MTDSIIDFLIGFFAVNALPHFLFGRLKIGVLSLFGFSPRANLAYAALCFCVALGLYGYRYGLSSVSEHMMFVGGLFVILAYFVSWGFVNRYLRHDP